MTYSQAIIKRLTELCSEKNITINKLATLSGITQSTVDNLMRGKTQNPKLKTLHNVDLLCAGGVNARSGIDGS